MMRIITSVAFLIFCSCTNNGDKSSTPDPAIDSTTTKTVDATGKDSNARENAGRMGDSTGTRSPHLPDDSSKH